MSRTIIFTALKKILGAKTSEDLHTLSGVFTLAGGTRSKCNNLKVIYQDVKYDSLSEAYYAYKLNELKKLKKIISYERQVNFKLAGRRGQRSLRYCCDFKVIGKSGTEYLVEIKGRILPEANVKLAYFEYVYKLPVYVVMSTGPEKFDTSFLV